MTELAIATGLTLLGVLGLQILFTMRFVDVYRRPAAEPIPDDQLPSVLLVLCLRGADPFLERTLRALHELDYPRLQIRIVVDSNEDPARSVVEQVIDTIGDHRITMRLLQSPQSTCGLRVSGLIQEFRDLPPEIDIVAWVDADVIPYDTWLRDLVAPFADPTVGAATGIRWYLPNPGGWGTMVRSIWNIGAIIQMVYFRIAFGGTMALRASIVRETDLLDRWSRLLWEDTYTDAAMRHAGYRLEFIPNATMANMETISLSSCYRFMCRQMLNARLYHRSWKFLLFFGIVSSAIPYIGIGVSIAALTQHLTAWGIGLLVLAVLQITGMTLLYALAGSYPNRVARRRRTPNWRFPTTVVLAVPLTAMVYAASLCRSLTARRVEWRGIEYRVRGPWEIELVEYEPYRPNSSSPHPEQPVSL